MPQYPPSSYAYAYAKQKSKQRVKQLEAGRCLGMWLQITLFLLITDLKQCSVSNFGTENLLPNIPHAQFNSEVETSNSQRQKAAL